MASNNSACHLTSNWVRTDSIAVPTESEGKVHYVLECQRNNQPTKKNYLFNEDCTYGRHVSLLPPAKIDNIA